MGFWPLASIDPHGGYSFIFLESDSSLSSTNLFLSLDGLSHDKDFQAVFSCKKVFDQFCEGPDKASKLYADIHQGLRTKVIDSVYKALKTVEKLLVLDNECLVKGSRVDLLAEKFSFCGCVTNGKI